MIDEEKLIDGSTWHPSVLTKKEPSYQDGWNDCNRDWMKRIAELPNAPDINVGNKWIPVSERLPEDNIWLYPICLVTLKNGDVCLGVYRHCDEEWVTRMSAGETVYSNKHEVLAWMPLPEPYKGEL